MPWKPSEPGEVPTLGWYVLDWMTENLAAPDRDEYVPFQPTLEQAQFILNFYAIDLVRQRRKIRRGVISRPKGWGKSPILSALGCVEGLGDVVFDGWDADGRPVGKPWSRLRTPWVQILATAEDQTKNAWAPLLEMLREGPACYNYPGLEPLDSFVNLPNKGKIEFGTSAATSKEGNKPIFAVLDQTEGWVASNGGIRLAATVRRNLGKTSGSSIEAPNAFVPGEGSVAEMSAQYWAKIQEGRARDAGLLVDHREWPAETDMSDRDSLMEGLSYVYGESAECNGGWVDLERIIAEIWDPATDPQDARQFYGNQITHATDSWLSQPQWAGTAATLKAVADDDLITLGFDGSRHRTNAVTDATALVGCRVSDGHVFTLGVWEQPDTEEARKNGWWPSTLEVDATVRDAFRRYNVVAFYADPAADWRSFVAGWEADFGEKLQSKVSAQHPIEWWMGGQNLSKTVRALAQFHSAVIHKEMSHDGTSALTRHILNTRRRQSRSGLTVAKEFPESSKKIDLAIAAVLAWQARIDAIGKGVLTTPEKAKSRRMRRF